MTPNSVGIEEAYRLAITIDERGDGSVLNDELIEILGGMLTQPDRERIIAEVRSEYEITRNKAEACKRCGGVFHRTFECTAILPPATDPASRLLQSSFQRFENAKAASHRALAILITVLFSAFLLLAVVVRCTSGPGPGAPIPGPAPDPAAYADGPPAASGNGAGAR